MIDAVLVDTNVFSARLRERSPLASAYAKHLFGHDAVFSGCPRLDVRTELKG